MIRISSLSFFSHLVWNALDILLRYSEAVVRRIWKIYGKTTVLESPFLKKIAAGWPKRHSNIVFFKNTFRRLLWKLRFFSRFLTVLFTHSRKNWNFSWKIYFSNNWALFAVYVWFLYDHEAKACWWVQQQDETAIILTKYSCKCEHYEN